MSYEMDRARWAQLSVVEQMGNIGSEVGRALNARRANDRTRFDAALDRVIDLFDASTDVLIAEKSYRVREVLRAKDQVLELLCGNDPTLSDGPAIEEYFLQFGVAARANR
jgi:hypothetical protein